MTDCAFRKSGLTSGHTVSSVDYVRAPIACTCVSVTSRFDLCRVCMESLLECFGMVQTKQTAGKHLKFPVSACLLVCEYKHAKTCVTWPSTPKPPSLAASPQGWWQRNSIPRTFCIFWMFFYYADLWFWYFNFIEKILTEISHSAKVTKHTKRINNRRKAPEFNPRNIDMISCTCSSHISEASRWIPGAGQPV